MNPIKLGYAILLPLLLLLAVGCSTPRMNTASGRPEVTASAPKSACRSALVSRLVDSGFTLLDDSESMVVADGPTNGWNDFWFTNTLTGERPKTRYRFTMVETSSSTRIVGTIFLAHAPGFSGRVSEAENTNPKAYERLQTFLNAVQTAAENPPRNR